MKKMYTFGFSSQIVAFAKMQSFKKTGLVAGFVLMFSMAAFSQTNYYLRTDSLNPKTGAEVRPDITNTKAWSTDGTKAGALPLDFITDGQIFNIQTNGFSAAGFTLNKAWTVSGVGSKIVIGSDTANVTFLLQGNATVTATFDVLANASLVLQPANTSTITWGNLATGSTVNFAGSTKIYQQVLAGSYSNLSFKSGGGIYLPLILPQQTIHVAGLFTQRASAIYGSTIDFNGTGKQTIPPGNYYNLTISGTKLASDSLQGTIFIAGAYNDISSGSPLVPYTLNKTTGVIAGSTINYNGLNTSGQSLGNGQSCYNLTFSNGRPFIVTSFSNANYTITLATPDPELVIGDSLSANSTLFPTLNLSAVVGITNDTVVTLSASPALRLIVHKAVSVGSKPVFDTVYVASYNNTASVGDPTDSTLTLTAPATFAAGDTLYTCQVLVALAVTKGVVTNAATLLVSSVTGKTVQLASLKAFSISANAGMLNGTVSFGTPTKLPTPKTVVGTVNIQGGFTPTGTITTTGSTFNYNNGVKQNIAGGKNLVYDNLTIQEASDSLATLNTAVLVQGILNLKSGKLATSATNLLTLDVNATFSSANSDSFYVSGPLAKNFASTTPFTYQIGKSILGVNYPKTVTITPKTADAKTYTVAYNYAKVANITKVDTSLDAIADTFAYYNVVLSKYTAGVDTSAQIAFNFYPDYAIDSSLVLAHYFHGKFTAESNPFVNNTVGIISTKTNSFDTIFGNYTLGIASPLLLPVKLGTISASALANKTVKLTWQSYSELNVAKYVIEGSADGVSFSTKGFVPAKGATEYSFVDVTPSAGINYYRIKVTDIDGKVNYSKVVSIKQAGLVVGNISVYPNPVKNKQLNFVLNTDAALYTLRVTNLLGQTVLAKTVSHTGGTASYSVSLPSVTAGIYVVKLSNGKTELTKTVIVE